MKTFPKEIGDFVQRFVLSGGIPLLALPRNDRLLSNRKFSHFIPPGWDPPGFGRTWSAVTMNVTDAFPQASPGETRPFLFTVGNPVGRTVRGTEGSVLLSVNERRGNNGYQPQGKGDPLQAAEC